MARIAHNGSGVFGPEGVPDVFPHFGNRAGVNGLWCGFGAQKLGLGLYTDWEFANSDRRVAGVADAFGGSGVEGGFGGRKVRTKEAVVVDHRDLLVVDHEAAQRHAMLGRGGPGPGFWVGARV